MEFGTFLHLLDYSSSVKAKDGCSLRLQPYSPLSLLGSGFSLVRGTKISPNFSLIATKDSSHKPQFLD